MKLAIVVPCYNEQEVIRETTSRLSKTLLDLIKDKKISNGQVYYVDDGSKDNTWNIISDICNKNNNGILFHGVKLSHNSGHQSAVWAGLESVVDKFDAVVTIDADLQDDVNAICEMADLFNVDNCEVVYGVRKERKTDTAFKRVTAVTFYKIMLAMGVDIVYNHADYRLMSNRVIKALMLYPERNIFLRGIVPLIGFKSANVYYDRAERFAGESKYPISKMINFAIDGITSFSVKPLRLISTIGFFSVLMSLCFAIWALVEYFMGSTIQGWTSILLSIWFMGGVQLLCIGTIGEYIGKTYKEVKRRPRYFIEKII